MRSTSSDPGAGRGGGDRRRRVFERGGRRAGRAAAARRSEPAGRQRRGERSAPSAAAAAEPAPPTSVGAGEGALNLIAWAGYVVGGTGGEQVQGYDWVTPFETATGCKVTVKVGLDSANMVQLMKTGQYDGVSASGDATLRLIAGGDVAPVNFDLIPNYKDIFDGPQEPVLQHGQRRRLRRAPRPRRQPPDVRPDGRHDRARQLERRVRRRLAVQGQGHRLRLRDLHRRRGAVPDEDQARPRITNPYALDETQFAAAVDLLKVSRRRSIGKYWGTAQEEIDGFANGDMAIGTTWQYQANTINAGRRQAGRERHARRRARPAGPTPG